jgi:hypothetical protein
LKPHPSAAKDYRPPGLNGEGGPSGFETRKYTTVALLEKQEEASPPRSPKKISSYLR